MPLENGDARLKRTTLNRSECKMVLQVNIFSPNLKFIMEEERPKRNATDQKEEYILGKWRGIECEEAQ